nr:MAG TPA: hypothetical protein [Caudoviricetes sp.]
MLRVSLRNGFPKGKLLLPLHPCNRQSLPMCCLTRSKGC